MRASSLPRSDKISIAGLLPDVPDATCSGAVLAWGAPVELSRLEPVVPGGSSDRVAPGDGGSVMPHVVFSHATCSVVKGAAMIRTHSSTIAGLSSRWSCNNCVSIGPHGYLATVRLRQPRGIPLLCVCFQPATHAPQLAACAAFPHSGGNTWAARPGFPPLTTFNHLKLHYTVLGIGWAIPQKVTHTFTVLTSQITHTPTFSTSTYVYPILH